MEVRSSRRTRAGIGLYRVPLTHVELDVLVPPGRLKEGDEYS